MSDPWMERLLEGTRGTVRAPRGFAHRVMDVVYKESLAAGRRPAPRRTASRLYRRLAWSFMLTAAVLAVSLLIPNGAYPTLVSTGRAEAGLGHGPSAMVQHALTGAGEAVQGALGEKQIRSNE